MNAIEFDGVGKLYRLGQVGTGTLSHDLNRWWQTRILGREDPYMRIGETNDRASKGHSDFVWALKDISFNVAEGEVVGIIGKNGAGKSTLLKLLSSVTAPTTGEIRTRGRIASLLEVGTGFHQEMTGRENIFMNGTIMGMTRAEIAAKLDAIVDFAGVERYLDTPVKRYSSGMTVRLGFAVAAFLEPEILVVDEVLAVGDAEFQKKAIGKMQDVSRGEGRTVLFVSHNMAAVRSLCQRGIVLENGFISYEGSIQEAISHYLNAAPLFTEESRIVNQIKWKKDYLTINYISIDQQESTAITLQPNQQTLNVTLDGSTAMEMKTDIMIFFRNKEGVPLATLAQGHYSGKIITLQKGPFHIECTLRLPKYLSRGDYYLDLFLHHPLYEFQMKAPYCAKLYSNGSHDEYGRSLYVEDYGLCGLETIDDGQ